MNAVEVTGVAIPKQQVDTARRKLASLERYVGRPLEDARLTIRRGPGRSDKPYVADASVRLDGRLIAAHAAGPSPATASGAAVARLRRQLRRVIDAQIALRNEPRAIRAALAELEPDASYRPGPGLKPSAERRILRRQTPEEKPEDTLDAVADMLDRDLEFLLFRHSRTDEDVVVYRRADGRIGLVAPRGSQLQGEDDLVVVEPNPYQEPMTVEQARRTLDESGRRFLYFIDSDDGLGKVLYVRHDGNYGLVEPQLPPVRH